MFKRNSAIPMPHHDVTKPDPLADVTLEVEGHKIYTSKYLLANISPKLLEICTKTSEKAGALSIAGNVLNVRAMVQLLAWALPSERVVVSDANAKWLFPLAIEFEIPKLREECEQFYDNLLTSSKKNEDHVDFLRLPHCSKVSKSYELAINHLAMQKMEEIKAVQGFTELSAEVTTDILTSRLKCFEDGTLKKECDVNIFQDEVTLVVEHKEIGVPVAAQLTVSPVFLAMLEHEFVERKTNRISLPGKSYEAVKLMVDYLCSPDHVDIPGSVDRLEECLAIAQEYMLGRLTQKCEEYMLLHCADVPFNEQLLYLRLAQTYNLPDVIKKVIPLCVNKEAKDFAKCDENNVAFASPLLLEITKRRGSLAKQVDQMQKKMCADFRAFVNRFSNAVNKSKFGFHCRECDRTYTVDRDLNKNCGMCARVSRRQADEVLQAVSSTHVPASPWSMAYLFAEWNNVKTKIKSAMGQ